MPELRQNIATREWVVIATERAKRPEQFIQHARERIQDRPAYASDCPFCPGNEELDLERLRIPVQGDWQLRVVRNRYPALDEPANGSFLEQPVEAAADGIHHFISGVGYHEVLVESRLHNTSPALAPVDDLQRMLLAFQLRGQAINTDPRIEQIIYFKNHGPSAGASLLHPHTQLIALPVVPRSIRIRVDDARSYYAEHGACVFCRMRANEEHARVRVLLETEYFTAFIPYAAYSPFHMWVLPRRHSASYLDATLEEIQDLGRVMHVLLRKVHFGLNDPDYNYILRSAPLREADSHSMHWYVAIVPRVTRSAGFELGSGMFINTALPEESARFLRSIEY